MKFKSNIEDLLNKITNDKGEIDYSKGNELLEADVTKFIDKNVDMETIQKEAKDTATNEFISGLAIDGVTDIDTFKQHLSKLGAEDKAQEVLRLTNELEALQGKYNTLESESNTYKGQVTQFTNEKFLLSKGANPDAIDFLAFKINQSVKDDVTFEQAYETYAKDNPTYFQPVAPVSAGNTGHTIAKGGDIGNKVDPIEQRLIDKGRIKN